MNETTASGLTVLRMRLPYVDQRSLSEAWISALGLRRDTTSSAPAGRTAAKRDPEIAPSKTRAISPATKSVVPRVAGYPDARKTGDRASNARVLAPRFAADAPAVRAARPGMRHRAECARSYAARRSSLTLGVAGERVQLVLRRDGHVLDVVALCRSDVAQTVGLALARAASFLRSRGDAMRASVRTFDDGAACR